MYILKKKVLTNTLCLINLNKMHRQPSLATKALLLIDFIDSSIDFSIAFLVTSSFAYLSHK